jgi:nicotinate-nucleotide adenylyltransferase
MIGKQRIGLFGGTFDPVHNGHLSLARELLPMFGLDQVRFIPAYAAPHKRGQSMTPALQRYAMLALATRRDDALEISSVELDAPAKPYTVETLTAIRAATDPETRLFFILGADSWAEIDSWRDHELVLHLTDHIVVTRPGFTLETRHVSAAIRDRVVDMRGFDRRSVLRKLESDAGPGIFFTDVAFADISATAIRKLVSERQERELKLMLPAEVADFIDKYELYK